MSLDREKPWQKNAANLLVVNSILAAISALMLQIFVTDPEPKHHFIGWVVCGALALFFFILSAEKITEAYLSADISSYANYCLPYNFGVGLLLVDVVGTIRHYEELTTFWTLFVSLVAFGGWMWGWGCDTLFLLLKD
jgi:hypothetical protein